VEERALERAEVECLEDENARARRREPDALKRIDEDGELQARMAQEIACLFPGCPADRAGRSRLTLRCAGRAGWVGRRPDARLSPRRSSLRSRRPSATNELTGTPPTATSA
jgi:hypothetical protein